MRPARALALAALLLVLLGSPAQAQTAPSVTVAIEADDGRLSVDEPASFSVTVTNAGQTSGTPLDDQNTADVTMSVSGVPAGWTASVTPASFRLAPGKTQTVSLQVSLAADAEAGTGTITVTATMKTPLERLDPILGNVPNGNQTTTGSDAIALTRDDSVTRNVLEAIGPWIYAILLLMVAAVLVAVAISVAARRALVRLAADTRELPVSAGGKVAFPFQAEGLAKQTDTVLLQVSAVQEGWAAFLPVPELTLEPGQVEDLTLVVIAPKDAAEGTRQAVLVTATSAKAPKGAANLEFVAVVERGAASAQPAVAPKRKK